MDHLSVSDSGLIGFGKLGDRLMLQGFWLERMAQIIVPKDGGKVSGSPTRALDRWPFPSSLGTTTGSNRTQEVVLATNPR